MNKMNQGSTFGINLAIVIYYFLPRMQVSTYSYSWNLIFDFRKLGVFLITVTMLFIVYQKAYLNKWKNIDSSRMVVGSYMLYLFATGFYIMLLEFI